MFWCCSLETSRPRLLPQSLKDCSIHLCLFFCFAYRVIINIMILGLSFSITKWTYGENSCPWSWWCHPAISSSVVPFTSCPQSLPASGSFPMSQLFTSGGQSIGVSASASVLPMNTQDWSALGWTGWISLQSMGLSRVFSNTPVEKHQFFGTQLSSQSNSHIHTWPLEKP